MTARNGFSLVEITISVVLISVMLAGVGGLVVRTQQNYNESLLATRAAEALRTAETTITTILKTGGADPLNTGNATFDPNYLNHADLDNFRVRSDFNPVDGAFTGTFEDVRVYVASDTLWIQWSASTDPQPVAAPVRDLTFEYYDAYRVLIATEADIPFDAVSVKVTLETDGISAADHQRSESWVFLRNSQ